MSKYIVDYKNLPDIVMCVGMCVGFSDCNDDIRKLYMLTIF